MIFRQYKNTNYWVSTCGNIYNMNRGIMMKTWLNKETKYKITKISYDGKKRDKLVHRLVAEVFIPNPENKPQVNHLDGNKLNNDLSNLEWATPSENQIHAFKLGLNHTRRKTGGVKLNLEIASEIVKLRKEGLSLTKISNKYNVTRGCIADVVQGKTWRSDSPIKKIKINDVIEFEDCIYVYLGNIDNEHSFAPFISHIETLQA